MNTQFTDNKLLLKKQAGKAAYKSILICFIICTLIFAVQLALSYLIYFLQIPINSRIFALILDMLIYAVSIILPVSLGLWMFKRFQNAYTPASGNNRRLRSPIVYIIGSIGLSYIVNSIIYYFFPVFANEYGSSIEINAQTPTETVLFYVLYALLPAFIEEWAFRRVILGHLLPFGRHGAVIVSSLLFGILHMDPPRVISSTLFGIALAYCAEHTGSIRLPVLIHFINNTVAVTGTVFETNTNVTVYLSLFIYLAMLICIYGLILYLISGIDPHRLVLKRTGDLSIGVFGFFRKTLFNIGIIPLAAIYSLIFIMNYAV